MRSIWLSGVALCGSALIMGPVLGCHLGARFLGLTLFRGPWSSATSLLTGGIRFPRANANRCVSFRLSLVSLWSRSQSRVGFYNIREYLAKLPHSHSFNSHHNRILHWVPIHTPTPPPPPPPKCGRLASASTCAVILPAIDTPRYSYIIKIIP
jgi:hypothetical protein